MESGDLVFVGEDTVTANFAKGFTSDRAMPRG